MNQLGKEREDKIVSVWLRIDTDKMRDTHLARDLFDEFALKCGKRRLAVLDPSTGCGPLARSVSVAHEKNTTAHIEDGSKDADGRHACVFRPNYD